MAAMLCTLPLPVPVESLTSCTGHISQPGLQTQTLVPFPRVGRAVSLRSRQERRGFREGGRRIHCAAAAEGGGEGKSCCGGSSGDSQSSASSGKCSSHGSSSDSNVDVSGIGKEFEVLVAQKTMQEFEAQYNKGELVGTISRDVISDVVNIYPETVSNSNEERFLDVEELIAEARALSSKDGDFIFDSDFEDMLV